MDKVKIILKKEIPPLKLDKGILSVSILDIIEGTYDDMFYKIINIISNNKIHSNKKYSKPNSLAYCGGSYSL